MKYKIEFDLPDNETIAKEIKIAPIQWAVWGYSGYAFATEVKTTHTLTMEDVKKISPPRIPTEPMHIPRRKETVAVHEEFTCPYCGFEFRKKYCPNCGRPVK